MLLLAGNSVLATIDKYTGMLVEYLDDGRLRAALAAREQNDQVVVMDASGKPSFSRLQQRGRLGSTIDMYGASAFTSVDIGTWTIGSTGNKTVRFNVTGKNASSSGFVVAIDYIKLTSQ